MKLFILFTILIWGSICTAGNQSFPRTGVLPEQITTEDSVMVGIAANIPPCLGSSNSFPTFYHLSGNNHITFVFVASIVSPCPIIQEFTLLYDIGTLPAGEYSMQVYTVGGPLDIPQSINDPLGTPLGDLVEFSVRGIDDVIPVPFISLWAVSLLIILILLVTFRFRKKFILFSIFTILFSPNISAKHFVLLISNESDVPTPEQIVNQATTSPPPGAYLLETFNEYRPNAVDYLLFQRPYGQRLELIEQYPDWTLSRLYQYLIVTYPEELLTDDLLISFDNDPYIIAASDINNIEGAISSTYKKRIHKPVVHLENK